VIIGLTGLESEADEELELVEAGLTGVKDVGLEYSKLEELLELVEAGLTGVEDVELEYSKLEELLEVTAGLTGVDEADVVVTSELEDEYEDVDGNLMIGEIELKLDEEAVDTLLLVLTIEDEEETVLLALAIEDEEETVLLALDTEGTTGAPKISF
jgi:hypothetical protein